MDKLMLQNLVDTLREQYPIEELMKDLPSFERGKIVGRLELIESLERLVSTTTDALDD
jgi:hypothetical protein